MPTNLGPGRGTRAGRLRPLWRCPRCGNYFVTRNLWHSCVRLTLAHHFAGKPRAKALFDQFRRVLRSFGPVRTVVSRTRIAFMVRVRFAGVTTVRRDSLRCTIWLTRRVASTRWLRVDRFTPRAYVHQFEIRAPSDLDAEMRRHLRESYAIGCQRHLSARAPTRRRPSRR